MDRFFVPNELAGLIQLDTTTVHPGMKDGFKSKKKASAVALSSDLFEVEE
jgi:hypothetical protein